MNVGQEIEGLKALGIRIAVISNASLLWRNEIRERLSEADWVSVKVDSVDPATWRRVNRPHRSLDLEKILDDIREFARIFRGQLVTGTMPVKGLNDSESDAEQVGAFVAILQPNIAYLSIPTRAPAEG